MNNHKDYLSYLITLEKHISDKHRHLFSTLFIQFYLYLTGSVHSKKIPKKNIAFYIAKLLRYVQLLLLKLKPVKADMAVWVADKSHINEVYETCIILGKKGKSVMFVSTKNELLKDPRISGFKTLFIPVPAASVMQENEITECMADLKRAETLAGSFQLNDAETELMAKCLQDWGSTTTRFSKITGSLLRRMKPEAAIIGYDIPIDGRAFTLVCKKNGVKTFMIQHGSVAVKNGIFSGHKVDHYMVYGELTKSILKDVNCESEVYVAGPPYLDLVKAKKKADIRQQTNRKNRILVAFSGPGHFTTLEHHQLSIKVLTTLVKQMPDTEFFLKFHPKDSLTYYTNLLPYSNVFDKLPNNNSTDIFDWLAHSDLLITGASTVCQEAMIINIPAICLDLLNHYSNVEFIKDKAVYYITSETQLSDTINKLFNGIEDLQIKQNAIGHVEHFFGNLDGKASTRCADHILEQLNKNGK